MSVEGIITQVLFVLVQHPCAHEAIDQRNTLSIDSLIFNAPKILNLQPEVFEGLLPFKLMSPSESCILMCPSSDSVLSATLKMLSFTGDVNGIDVYFHTLPYVAFSENFLETDMPSC